MTDDNDQTCIRTSCRTAAPHAVRPCRGRASKAQGNNRATCWLLQHPVAGCLPHGDMQPPASRPFASRPTGSHRRTDRVACGGRSLTCLLARLWLCMPSGQPAVDSPHACGTTLPAAASRWLPQRGEPVCVCQQRPGAGCLWKASYSMYAYL